MSWGEHDTEAIREKLNVIGRLKFEQSNKTLRASANLISVLIVGSVSISYLVNAELKLKVEEI